MTGNFKPAVPVYSAVRLYQNVVSSDSAFKTAVLTLATETTITDKVYNSSTYAGTVEVYDASGEPAGTVTPKTIGVSAADGADFSIDFDNFTAGIDGLDNEWAERIADDGWTTMRLTEKNSFNANFRAKAAANGDEFSLSIRADRMVLSNFKNTGTTTIVDTWANKSSIFA